MRAMLDKELLDILVCPTCKQPLTYSEAQQTLRCSACRRVYPVRDGIPVLLVEEAKVE
jgi:LSD1 subclass zinc finger protein